jgi:hypothetical protein
VKNNEVTEIDILTMLNENKVSKDKAIIAQKLLTDFKNSSIYSKIKNSDVVLCEVPFSLKIDSEESRFKVKDI